MAYILRPFKDLHSQVVYTYNQKERNRAHLKAKYGIEVI